MVMQQRTEVEQVLCLGHQLVLTLEMLLHGEVLTDIVGRDALGRNSDNDIWRAVCTFLTHSSQH